MNRHLSKPLPPLVVFGGTTFMRQQQRKINKSKNKIRCNKRISELKACIFYSIVVISAILYIFSRV